MKSYSTLRNLFGTITNNTESTNLTLGDQLINDSIRRIIADRDWPFLQSQTTSSTVAGTQFYNLPYDFDQLIDVSVTVGTTRYIPTEASSQEQWDLLNQNTTFQSSTPEYFYILNGQIGFWPIPSTTTSNNIRITYRKRIIDLSRADYTTGTVDAVTSGSSTVTGSGTSWTTPMSNRWLRITNTDTASSSGDGNWYQISAVASGTSLTLTRTYGGTTLTSAAGASYTIGEMPILPEAYHDLPVYEAAYIFYSSINPDATRAQTYRGLADHLFARLKEDYGSKTLDPTIRDSTAQRILNPNLFITA